MRILFLLCTFSIATITHAQKGIRNIRQAYVTKVISALSNDSMQGRKVFTNGIDKAAAFISNEMNAAGLKPFDTLKTFYQTFSLTIRKPDKQLESGHVSNLIGYLPGTELPNEYIIFSAHYDHIGTGTPNEKGDSIFNGANDNASGVAAMLSLAKYYAGLKNNKRSILFVAFAAEETGLDGSRYFSEHVDAERIVAMINIEMVGTTSKWGGSAAYLTGFDKSNLGELLNQNINKNTYRFYPDPYLKQKLFERSDNAALAKKGVPAHTISTSKMDNEPHYHKLDDEINSLDLQNLTNIIRSIAMSTRPIVDARQTPSRIKKN